MKPLILTRFSVAVLLFFLAPLSLAQDNQPSPSPGEKAEQIVQRALKAVGGDRYLQVKTQIGRGFFTEFRDGVSGLPIKFVDYIAYPEKERTEFTGGGGRAIQTQFRGGGWVCDW